MEGKEGPEVNQDLIDTVVETTKPPIKNKKSIGEEDLIKTYVPPQRKSRLEWLRKRFRKGQVAEKTPNKESSQGTPIETGTESPPTLRLTSVTLEKNPDILKGKPQQLNFLFGTQGYTTIQLMVPRQSEQFNAYDVTEFKFGPEQVERNSSQVALGAERVIASKKASPAEALEFLHKVDKLLNAPDWSVIKTTPLAPPTQP
jgi:hypothetical protein